LRKNEKNEKKSSIDLVQQNHLRTKKCRVRMACFWVAILSEQSKGIVRITWLLENFKKVYSNLIKNYLLSCFNCHIN